MSQEKQYTLQSKGTVKLHDSEITCTLSAELNVIDNVLSRKVSVQKALTGRLSEVERIDVLFNKRIIASAVYSEKQYNITVQRGKAKHEVISKNKVRPASATKQKSDNYDSRNNARLAITVMLDKLCEVYEYKTSQARESKAEVIKRAKAEAQAEAKKQVQAYEERIKELEKQAQAYAERMKALESQAQSESAVLASAERI